MRSYGIRTVIDVRGDDEATKEPSLFREGVCYRRVPLSSLRMMALHHAAHAGRLAEELRAIAVAGGGLSDVVRAIAAAEPGIVLHCAAGRDRTGIVVATLLAAIGVPDAEIVEDYVLSDEALADEYERFKAANPERAAAVDAGVAKRAWVMGETLKAIREVFGGGSAYLQLAGVPPEDLATIRTKLVA